MISLRSKTGSEKASVHSRVSPLQWLAVALSLAGLAILVSACGALPGHQEREMNAIREAARGKNLVMVLLDAGGYGHFGFAGYDRETTPNIDALAAQSLVFDTAYSEAASTGHSVFAMLTSSYPFWAEKQGLKGIIAKPFKVDEKTNLMADILKAKFGRRLAISGNPWFGPDFGFDRGFSKFYEIYDNEAVPDSTEHFAARTVDAFKRDMESWGDQQVFAYLHFLEPHTPYKPPEDFARKFDPVAADIINPEARYLLRYRLNPPDKQRQEMIKALYDGNLAYADSKVGEVIESLKKSGRWDNTVFVVIADHGEAFWEHGVYAHGRHIYEEFMRIPFIVHIPGAPMLSGRHVKEPVSLVDLLPTYLDLYGIQPPKDLKGGSLLPLIAGRTKEFKTRKIFLRNTHSIVPEFGLRAGRYKWIYRVYESSYQLYDLVADPKEQHDLVKSNAVPPEVEELRKEIGLWIATGTGQVQPVEKLDPKTEERLRAIGYF